MKSITRIFLMLFLALALLAAPSTVLAQDGGDGKVVMGGSYELAAGQTLNGSLAVFGGEATIEDGARVNGDVAVMGGTLTVGGEVNGNIAVMGGTVFLSDTAEVHGDIRTLGGTVNRDPGATVDGTISSGPSDWNFNLPRLVPDQVGDVLGPIWSFFIGILQAFVMAAIAVLVGMFMPAPTQRVASTVTAQPVVSGAIGLLTLIVAPVLIVLLAITLILIPVALLALLALVLLVAYGWIAVGLELGQRMGASLFHTNWTPPVAAGIGTLVLSLLAAVVGVIPCVGWLLPFLVIIVGLGGVLASKFGAQVYSRPVTMTTTYAPSVSTPAAPVHAPATSVTTPVAPATTPAAPVITPAESGGAQTFTAPPDEPLPPAE